MGHTGKVLVTGSSEVLYVDKTVTQWNAHSEITKGGFPRGGGLLRQTKVSSCTEFEHSLLVAEFGDELKVPWGGLPEVSAKRLKGDTLLFMKQEHGSHEV